MKIKNDLPLSTLINSLFCTSVILFFSAILLVQVGCEEKIESRQEASPAVEAPVIDVFAITDNQIRQRINELYAEMMELRRKGVRTELYISRVALVHAEITLLLHVRQSRR